MPQKVIMEKEAEDRAPPQSKEPDAVSSAVTKPASVEKKDDPTEKDGEGGPSMTNEEEKESEPSDAKEKETCPEKANLNSVKEPTKTEEALDGETLPPKSSELTLDGGLNKAPTSNADINKESPPIKEDEDKATNLAFVPSLSEDMEMMKWEATGSFSFDKKEPMVAMKAGAADDKEEDPSTHKNNALVQNMASAATTAGAGESWSLPPSEAATPSVSQLSHSTIAQSSLTLNDVLCGRGGGTNTHEGNRRYRSIVNEHRPEYLRAKKRDKAVIARHIVDSVREQGGRFMEKRGNCWVDTGDDKAVKKTLQALREGLDVRKTLMSMSSKKLSLQEITSADVLCGGCPKTTGQHFGNRRFDVLVNSRKEIYSAAGRGKKSTIAKSIISIVKAQGGRFLELKKEDQLKLLQRGVPFQDTKSFLYESWVEVDFDKANKKTLRALREAANDQPQKDESDGNAGTNASESTVDKEESTSTSPAKKQKIEATVITLEEAEQEFTMRWCDCPICQKMRAREATKKKMASEAKKTEKKRPRGRPRGSVKKTTTVTPKTDIIV